MKRGVWGRKRVFMGCNCMFCFFTFVCYLHVIKETELYASLPYYNASLVNERGVKGCCR